MATTITAGNGTNGGAAVSSDNTGILELKTGSGAGTTALTLDTSQNVGIGTTSPATQLQVTNSANTGATVRLSSSATSMDNGTLGTLDWYSNDSSTGGTGQKGYIKVLDDTGFGTNYAMTFGTGYVTGGATAISEWMRLNSSGNLGLGVTPSAWRDTTLAIQLGNYGSVFAYKNSGNIYLNNNSYTNSVGNEIYLNTAPAGRYRINDNVHAWYIAPSGTAGNAITFTQAMTLDASGILLVGTTSASASLAAGGLQVTDRICVGTGSVGTPSLHASGDTNTGLYFPGADIVGFATGGTERARITSGGYSKASDNGTYYNSTGTFHEFYQSANDTGLAIKAANASYTNNGVLVDISRNTTNNSFYAISYYNAGAAAYKFRVADSGTVTNTTGTYTTISDIKLKQDIVDASSQWDDIKALRIVKYRLKEYVQNDPDSKPFLGLIAQEVEQVCPSLVEEQEDEVMDEDGKLVKNGEVTKGVKTSILYMKAVKALQEAMTRIETLEAEVAALKGAAQ